jgi:hypothetical protein
MTAMKAPSVGFAGGCVRREPGGTENRIILATVLGSIRTAEPLPARSIPQPEPRT